MNSYRAMRTIVFFDLPVEKAKQRRAYASFLKSIKKYGFFMLQESVYAKLDLDQRAANSTLNVLKQLAPKEGSIAVLTITEKQFAGINFILGEPQTDVETSDKRTIEI